MTVNTIIKVQIPWKGGNCSDHDSDNPIVKQHLSLEVNVEGPPSDITANSTVHVVSVFDTSYQEYFLIAKRRSFCSSFSAH
jgi:hypothetical protein